MARIRTEEYKARRRARERDRYANDPEWRERKKQANLDWQHANPEKIQEHNNRRAAKEKAGQKRKRNPDTERVYHLKKAYGIAVEEYDRILAMQRGRCAICGTDDPKKKYFSVDHDHQTGKVRGLLCQPCNIALGHLRDDLDVVLAMAVYLMQRKAASSEGVYCLG